MNSISVSQFAESLNIPRTSLSRVIQEIEREQGVTIGKTQGNGKPKLLSPADQEILRARLNKPVEQATHPPVEVVEGELMTDTQHTTPGTESTSITLYSSDRPVPELYKTAPLKLKVLDTSANIDSLLAEFMAGVEAAVTTADLTESALLTKAVQEGAELGAKLAAIKISTVQKSSDRIMQQWLKKQGLVEDETQS